MRILHIPTSTSGHSSIFTEWLEAKAVHKAKKISAGTPALGPKRAPEAYIFGLFAYFPL
jgi:hypothetical protein